MHTQTQTHTHDHHDIIVYKAIHKVNKKTYHCMSNMTERDGERERQKERESVRERGIERSRWDLVTG